MRINFGGKDASRPGKDHCYDSFVDIEDDGHPTFDDFDVNNAPYVYVHGFENRPSDKKDVSVATKFIRLKVSGETTRNEGMSSERTTEYSGFVDLSEYDIAVIIEAAIRNGLNVSVTRGPIIEAVSKMEKCVAEIRRSLLSEDERDSLQ